MSFPNLFYRRPKYALAFRALNVFCVFLHHEAFIQNVLKSYRCSVNSITFMQFCLKIIFSIIGSQFAKLAHVLITLLVVLVFHLTHGFL